MKKTLLSVLLLGIFSSALAGSSKVDVLKSEKKEGGTTYCTYYSGQVLEVGRATMCPAFIEVNDK